MIRTHIGKRIVSSTDDVGKTGYPHAKEKKKKERKKERKKEKIEPLPSTI